jgi:iron(III) transport system permease protein
LLLTLIIRALGGGGSTRSHQTVTGKGFRPAPLPLGRARPWVNSFVVLFFLFAVVAPFAVLLYVSLSPFYRTPTWESLGQLRPDNYQKLVQTPGLSDALTNTVLLAVISATIVMVLTTVASYFVARSQVRARRLLDALAFTPLVIPGVVLGLGLSFVYLRSPIPIYGTVIILVVAYVTRFIPYGMRYAGSALSQIGNELEEAAQVAGATWWRTMRRVLLPLAGPGILSGWIFVLMIAFRELSVTALLVGPESEVLSVVLFRQYGEGTFGTVAALGVLMVTVLLVLILAAYRLGSRFGVRIES